MNDLLKYIKNNPLYLVAWIIILPFFLYVLWEGVWPLVYLFGMAMIILVVGARQSIKRSKGL